MNTPDTSATTASRDQESNMCGIDAVLSSLQADPSLLQIQEAIYDPEGLFAVISSADEADAVAAPPERALPMEHSISIQEARDLNIVLAPRNPPATDRSIQSEELDYGDSDDEDIEAEVEEEAAEEVIVDHDDLNDAMLAHMARAPPGGAHTINTALDMPQAGETEVVSVVEPIPQQEDRKSGRLGVEKDGADPESSASGPSDSFPSNC